MYTYCSHQNLIFINNAKVKKLSLKIQLQPKYVAHLRTLIIKRKKKRKRTLLKGLKVTNRF